MASIRDETYFRLAGPSVPKFVVSYVKHGQACERDFSERASAERFKSRIEARRAPIERANPSDTATTYDAAAHTVEMILSEGSPVERWYGVEVLSMDPGAIDIGRLRTSGIPLLDSHDSSSISRIIGNVTDIRVGGGRVVATASFGRTEIGKLAEGMVARGELKGVSIGYRVDAWEITDADGNVITPGSTFFDADDNLTFKATRWVLHEASFVAVPADPTAIARNGRRQGQRRGKVERFRLGEISRGVTPAYGYISRGA